MTGVTSGAELLTLPEHLGSPPLFSWVRVARSLVLCLVFCRSFLFLLTIFYCPLYCLSSFVYRFWLLLWDLFLGFLGHFSLTKSSVREVTELMDNKQFCKLAHLYMYNNPLKVSNTYWLRINIIIWYDKFIKYYITIYYGFSLLHIFSLVLQPWMSACIRKTDEVYISVPQND